MPICPNGHTVPVLPERSPATCPECGIDLKSQWSADLNGHAGSDAVSSVEACLACGGDLPPSSRFCPWCAEPAVEELTVGITVEEMIAHLEARLVSDGTVVLANVHSRRPKRLEVDIEEATSVLFDEDRTLLLDALREALLGDAFLYGELDDEGDGASCVWHLIHGLIIPLGAQHARGVVEHYPILLPTGVEVVEAFAFSDAPDLTAGDDLQTDEPTPGPR